MEGAETGMLEYGIEIAVGLDASSCFTCAMFIWLEPIAVGYMDGGWFGELWAVHGSEN